MLNKRIKVVRSKLLENLGKVGTVIGDVDNDKEIMVWFDEPIWTTLEEQDGIRKYGLSAFGNLHVDRVKVIE